jgi:beta-fructofuranosidase
MNDPCGPVYNAHTGFYHLGFQWNPSGCVWGNMSWGSMQSADLLHWTVSETPSMVKGGEGQDPEGVYSGCVLAVNPSGEADGTLTAFYTSCNHLPLHYTLPYTYGSERLHMATSRDNGRSWQKYADNSLLDGPPEGISVYGWRDPFVSPWPAVDRLRGKPAGSLYGIISGSLRRSSPTVFLYELDASDLREWKFLAPLTDMSSIKPSRWTGDFGINWEVANFVPLCDDNGQEHQFLIVGAEGVNPIGHRKQLREGRSGSSQLWLSGTLGMSHGAPRLDFTYGGILDHGCFYAGNSFFDPIIREQVIFGWIMEADIPESHYCQQGWAGVLSLPRILKVITLRNVCGTLATPLEQLANFSCQYERASCYSMHTLAALPDPRLERLRGQKISLPSQASSDEFGTLHIPAEAAAQWDLEISFSLGPGDKQVGFDIIHSIQTMKRTSITFDTIDEKIIVDRNKSTSNPDINTASEEAPHTLFLFDDEPHRGTHSEPLSIRAIFDSSVLEVFVNSRTAITTRVYPDHKGADGDGASIRPFSRQASSTAPNAKLERCDLWHLNLDHDTLRGSPKI